MGFSATSFMKWADAAFGPLFCSALSRAQERPEPRTLADFPEGSAVLVARPGGIGDATLLLPALAALRSAFPRSPVDALCESRNAPVFEASGLVRRVLRFDSEPIATLSALRRGGWAVFCDTEQFHHFSAVMGAVSRAPVRVGFAVNPARHGLYSRLVPYDLAGPESAQFSRLVANAAGRALRVPPLKGVIPPERLPPPPPGLPPRFAAIHAGASVPRKRWGADRWKTLSEEIRARFGLETVFVGAESGLPLAGTVAVLARAEVSVGADSGLAHLAVAAGTPAVVLFGPGDPAKWGPPPGMGEAVRAATPCSPCSMFGTLKPCRRALCMEGISAEAVLEAVGRVLS